MVACLHNFEINKYLREPIIWIFVPVISDFEALLFSNWTTCKVAFANKSSEKLGASDATKQKQLWLYYSNK
jgi:competence transcription factor ComK